MLHLLSKTLKSLFELRTDGNKITDDFTNQSGPIIKIQFSQYILVTTKYLAELIFLLIGQGNQPKSSQIPAPSFLQSTKSSMTAEPEDLPVILGVPDDPVYEPAEEGVTKIGGSPHWLCGEPAGLDKARCEKCGAVLALILSADCPLDGDFDRIIYLYVCPRCGRDAKAWRQKRPVGPSSRATADACPIFTADDFQKPARANAADLLAQLAALGEPEKPKKGQKEPEKVLEKGVFPAYYIDTFDEPEASLDPSVHYTISTSVDSVGSGMGEEDRADVAVDPVLVEYNEKMSRCPSQVIRYCREGTPLLQEPMKLRVPKCPSCGAERVFEVELLPTVIYQLAPESEMDFGPILVFTCGNDCGQGSCEEHCIVCPP